MMEAGEWQPIETAPDSRWIDILVRDHVEGNKFDDGFTMHCVMLIGSLPPYQFYRYIQHGVVNGFFPDENAQWVTHWREPEWQPIHLAPRDGQVIEITAIEDDGSIFEIHPMQWAHIQRNELFAPGVVGMWTAPDGSYTWREGDGGPTHWRIPPPSEGDGMTPLEKAAPTTAEVLAAINVVKAHLDADWISDGCYEAQAFGCVSCRAVQLRKELTLLTNYLIEDDASRP